MLHFLPPLLKGIFSSSIWVINTICCCLLIYPFAILKLIIPFKQSRHFFSMVMIKIAEFWIAVNGLNMALTQKIKWSVTGLESLVPNQSYLIMSNHQTWVDIVVLQAVFNRKIPFIRFFLKQELLYVPFLGLAWWALDFPFMKRYSADYLRRHPEKRGADFIATKKACDRLKDTSVSILNFLEGTRFSSKKQAALNSQFKHLLPPKTGGITYVLQAMGEQFSVILDVTIFYPAGAVELWDAFCGRLPEVVVKIQQLPISEFISDQESSDRGKIKSRILNIWASKDQLLQEYHS